MQEKSYNVLHELILSFYKFSAYKAFAKNKGGKTFLYGLILSVIQYIVFFLTAVTVINTGFSTAYDFIDESFPDFLMEDGVLYMDQVIEKDENDIYICIDTDSVFYLDDLSYLHSEGYSDAVLMDSEKALILNDGKMQQLDFSDINDIENSITKDTITDLMPTIKGFIIGCCALSIFYFVIVMFWSAFWYSLFMLIINAILNARLTFGEIYKISLHACTINLALWLAVYLMPGTIPSFWVIRFIVVMVYGFFAIKAIKRERELEEFEINSNVGNGENVLGVSQNPYGQQNGTYQQPNQYGQQSGAYQQPNPYGQQDGAYQQPNQYGQQSGAYQQPNPYGQQSGVYQQPNPYGQENGTYQQPNPYPQQTDYQTSEEYNPTASSQQENVYGSQAEYGRYNNQTNLFKDNNNEN